jgi:hypothetical protein
VVARYRADVFTEGCAEVGTIVANVAVHQRRGGGYRCEVRLAEARVAVEPGERITEIGERTLRVEAVLGGVALLSTVAFANVNELRPDPAALTDGFGNAFLVGAGFALVGLLIATFAVRTSDSQAMKGVEAVPVAG